MKEKVVVVGAGLSGLAAVKELLEVGLDVVCYEMRDDIGGVFSDMGCYDSVLLTVSNHFMAYSDYMPYEEPTRFWTRKEYKNYLDRYAEKFDLRSHIRFGWKLLEVVDPTGDCQLIFESESGERLVEHCDRAVICSGQFQEPNIPSLPGMETFAGEVLHSSAYTNVNDCQQLSGKRVLFFGLGESAADVVTEIAEIAESSVLSIRRPHVFSSRMSGRGVPIDVLQSRFWHSLPAAIKAESVRSYWRSEQERTEPGSAVNSLAKHMVESLDEPGSVVTKTERVFEAVSEGMEVDVGGVKSISGNKVTFNSGRVQEFDALVFCTGFKLSLPFLADEFKFTDVRDLYLQCYHPELKDKLAFIGFARPQQGGVPLMSEMLSRYHALVLSGKRRLPDNLSVLAQQDKEMWQQEFYETPEVAGLVNGLRFNEKIAKLVGCQPPKPSFFTSPRDYYYFWNHHIWPSQYRMVGPGSRPEAKANWKMAIHAYRESPTGFMDWLQFYRHKLSIKLKSMLASEQKSKWRPYEGV